MRVICHDRSFLTRCTYITLGSFLVCSITIASPSSGLASELPLGLAIGSKEAHVTAEGKQWAILPAFSSPIYEGTMIRTGKGAASVILKAGTQLELPPRTVIGLSGSRTAPIVRIALGRVFFRLSASSHTVFVTPTARYQTKASNRPEGAAIVRVAASMPSSPDLVGEIAVNPREGSRIALQQGEMLAGSLSDPGLHIVKAGQSVHSPQVGNRDAGFSTMLAQALPDEQAEGGTPAPASVEGTAEAGGAMGGGAATGMGTTTAMAFSAAGAVGGLGFGMRAAFSGGKKASPSAP